MEDCLHLFEIVYKQIWVELNWRSQWFSEFNWSNKKTNTHWTSVHFCINFTKYLNMWTEQRITVGDNNFRLKNLRLPFNTINITSLKWCNDNVMNGIKHLIKKLNYWKIWLQKLKKYNNKFSYNLWWIWIQTQYIDHTAYEK